MKRNEGGMKESQGLAPAPLDRRAMAIPREEVTAVLPAYEAVWPSDLTPTQKAWAARVALAYGLDPLMGELEILGGKPYVTVDGRLRKVTDRADYEGFDFHWVSDPKDREILQLEDGDLVAKTTVYRTGRRPTVAFGIVRKAEREEMSRYKPNQRANPILDDNPQEVCYKRAVARALRYAFSLPLPGVEDALEMPPDVAGQRRVNPDTGEVTEVIEGEPNTAGCTARQRATIHALWNTLKLPDQEAHQELIQLYGMGVDSTMKLNVDQASRYIDALMKRANIEAEELQSKLPMQGVEPENS